MLFKILVTLVIIVIYVVVILILDRREKIQRGAEICLHTFDYSDCYGCKCWSYCSKVNGYIE